MVVSGKSYVFVPIDSNSFYASDLSIIDVRKKDNSSLLEGQMAEYLTNTACNFKIFKDLFSAGSIESVNPTNDSFGFYQIGQ